MHFNNTSRNLIYLFCRYFAKGDSCKIPQKQIIDDYEQFVGVKISRASLTYNMKLLRGHGFIEAIRGRFNSSSVYRITEKFAAFVEKETRALKVINIAIGLDSNALTYLVDAMASGYDPEKDKSGMAAEKVAMLRIYFYGGEPFYVVPTVESEYKNIVDRSHHEMHKDVHAILMYDYPEDIIEKEIEKRARKFVHNHVRYNDCKVVAEAELAGLNLLLTCDSDLIRHLKGASGTLRLMKPTELWAEMNLLPGTRPILIPHSSNPLSRKTWWQI